MKSKLPNNFCMFNLLLTGQSHESLPSCFFMEVVLVQLEVPYISSNWNPWSMQLQGVPTPRCHQSRLPTVGKY